MYVTIPPKVLFERCNRTAGLHWCRLHFLHLSTEVQYVRFIRNRMFISCILFSTDHMGGGYKVSDEIDMLHFMTWVLTRGIQQVKALLLW